MTSIFSTCQTQCIVLFILTSHLHSLLALPLFFWRKKVYLKMKAYYFLNGGNSPGKRETEF